MISHNQYRLLFKRLFQLNIIPVLYTIYTCISWYSEFGFKWGIVLIAFIGAWIGQLLLVFIIHTAMQLELRYKK